jgi:hypothetical protein
MTDIPETNGSALARGEVLRLIKQTEGTARKTAEVARMVVGDRAVDALLHIAADAAALARQLVEDSEGSA